MFPIAKAVLSFREISDYWSREINPRVSRKELLHTLEAAWWLGELRGDSVDSRLQMLQKMFTAMRHRDDLGIVFVIGNSPGPLPIQLPDGSYTADVRQQIRVPSTNIDTWDESSCREAFQALAEKCSLDSYPELAVGFAWISLSYEEFITWCEKRGFPDPTFWRPRPEKPKRDAVTSNHDAVSRAEVCQEGDIVRTQKKKSWKAESGKKLTRTETAIVKVLNEIWPDGGLDHKAKARDKRINTHLANDRLTSQVSPRTIQRALGKVHFA